MTTNSGPLLLLHFKNILSNYKLVKRDKKELIRGGKWNNWTTALNFGEKQNQLVMLASNGEFMFARLEDVKKRALLCEINLASILMQFHTKLPRTALKV